MCFLVEKSCLLEIFETSQQMWSNISLVHEMKNPCMSSRTGTLHLLESLWVYLFPAAVIIYLCYFFIYLLLYLISLLYFCHFSKLKRLVCLHCIFCQKYQCWNWFKGSYLFVLIIPRSADSWKVKVRTRNYIVMSIKLSQKYLLILSFYTVPSSLR